MRPALAVLLFAAVPAAAQTHIAPTDALSPAAAKKTFTVPPGFEVQLVAAEPDIGKPIQTAFDAKGRLWVTTSRHYPFPAADGATPSDRLFVLSDFGPDGKARKVETFANDLNIPIGVLPLPDCKSCLVSHVGSILKLTDTNGDGKADTRETILSGFGAVDTHGMTNSFLLLPDGWVYATHGFRNESVVKAKDGSEVRMQSGNTYRFRPDGSRVEPWTFGQVNPFGLCVDPWLNLYTADCHSKPITQLIRGAHYQSFGKPHDGLGFAPHVTEHDHKSTALCGLTWYEADHFPKEWQGCMFLGNVTGNRVNVDRIEWRGATPVAKELPDFLVSSDPWFRPTDVKLGPDGALYVADFYNKIIGHYEVDLKHPGRDKDRGRVWRIVYTGKDGKGKPPVMPFADLTTMARDDAWKLVTHPCLTTRLLATEEMCRRGAASVANLGEDLPSGSLALWPLFRAGLRPVKIFGGAFEQSRGDLGLMHSAAKVLAARPLSPDEAGLLATVNAGLTSRDPKPRSGPLSADRAQWMRAWVDVLAANPAARNLPPLVEEIRDGSAEDTHLRYAARVALRNALGAEGAWADAAKADAAVIADVAYGVHTKDAAAFLLAHTPVNPRVCEHVGRYGDDVQAAAVVDKVKARANAAAALLALVRGLQARGAGLPADARPAVEEACGAGLSAAEPNALQAATDLAATLRLGSAFDPLAKLATRADRNEAQRAAALAAMLAIDPNKATPILSGLLTTPTSAFALQQKAAEALAGSNRPDARAALLAALQTVPSKLASVVAASLASSPGGIEALLTAVKDGKASARLLQEPAVAFRIASAEGGKYKGRLEELTRGLPSADAKLAALIRTRAAGFTKAKPDVAAGKAVFAKNCGICHQLGGEGAKVGPQLDGVGARGAERLLEDVLDPNRNVDGAFRATTLTMLDGRTLTGQVVREEGQVTVIVDAAGKEHRAEAKDVEKKVVSPLSVMPANMETAVPEADFYHLLGYLLEQRAKSP